VKINWWDQSDDISRVGGSAKWCKLRQKRLGWYGVRWKIWVSEGMNPDILIVLPSQLLTYLANVGSSKECKLCPVTFTFMWHVLTNSGQFRFLAFSIVTLPHEALTLSHLSHHWHPDISDHEIYHFLALVPFIVKFSLLVIPSLHSCVSHSCTHCLVCFLHIPIAPDSWLCVSA